MKKLLLICFLSNSFLALKSDDISNSTEEIWAEIITGQPEPSFPFEFAKNSTESSASTAKISKNSGQLAVSTTTSASSEVTVPGFPTTKDYFELANQTLEDFKRLVYADEATEFPELERENDDATIRLRESPFPEAKEKIMFGKSTINAPPSKLIKLIIPWEPYRLQWDHELYEKFDVIKALDNTTYLIHQVTKKMFLMDPRDSISVYKEETFENGSIIMVTQSTSHPDYPEVDGIKRTSQRLSGYLIEPSKSNNQSSDIKVIIATDLNLPVPSFFSSVVEKFKPGQFEKFFQRLKEATTQVNVN